MIGDQVLHFRVLRRLGQGGMGEVYLAEDTRLKRQVALKFLSPQVSSDPELKARFENEAVAAAALSHPNIVTIHELAEHDGRLLMAMEYVHGRALDEVIREGQLTLPSAIKIACQLCEALAQAHAAGIVHCDIKPSNILVGADGTAKILDFGIARSRRVTARWNERMRLGTLPYQSPEQVTGLEPDHRSDLFSCGVVLYEMVCGCRPFDSEYAEGIQYAILNDSPEPLARYLADAPEQLQSIVNHLLAKATADRYADVSAVLADLRRLATQLEGGALPGSTRMPRRLPSIAVLPFNDLSTGAELTYVCEGIAEEITSALARITGIHVAARTSAFALGRKSDDIRAIGRKLGVTTLLEGSVQKADSRLRIWAQLIKVTDGFHLWSERYDREAEDVLAIQDEIARQIVGALQVVLSEEEKEAITKSPTLVAEAYDLYMRGRQHFRQGRKKNMIFARELFERATQADPRFALAFAGVANCSSLLVHLYGETRDANLRQADSASARALELDFELAEAHAARGFALWLLNHNTESFREFERAIELAPDLFEAHYFYARECFQLGELEHAAALFESACRVHEDYEARYFAAQTYSALGQPENAQRAYRLALLALEKHLELNPGDARAVTMGAVSLCRLGEAERGLQWAQRALAIDPDDARIRYNVACLYALEGDKDKAIGCLEAALEVGFAHRDWVEHDPDLDSLRDDPRFRALKWRETA